MATISIYETQDGPTTIECAELVGTGKQVAYGADRRRDRLEQLFRQLNEWQAASIKKVGPERVAPIYDRAREMICNLAATEASASWWINDSGGKTARDYTMAAAKEIAA